MICSKFNKLISIFFISFIFFSCATSPKTDRANNQDTSQDVPETTENNENLTNESNDLGEISGNTIDSNIIDSNNNEVFTKSENLENQVTDLENSEDTSEDNFSENQNTETNKFSQNIFPQLDDIEEPEVIELEPPEENVQENINLDSSLDLTEENFDDEVLEIVDDEDLITPDITDYTSSDSQVQDDNIIIETTNSETDISVITDNSENNLSETSKETLTNTEDSNDVIDVNDVNNFIEGNTEDSDSQNYKDDDNEEKITVSRSVTLKKLEYLDVTYPGKGWIFMGLTDNSKDITYFGRKVGSNDTKFSLQAKNSGTKILHFYKNDTLTNEYIDDYFEVIILDEKGSNKTRIEAPKYVPLLKQENKFENSDDSQNISSVNTDITSATNGNNKSLSNSKNEVKKENEIKPSNEIKSEKFISDKKEEVTNYDDDDEVITLTDTITETQSEETETLPDPEELYKEALQYFNSQNFKNAEEKLHLGLQAAITGKDKFLFLLGQLYEADSDIQNINKAIDEYSQIINNYPASSYWDKANKRIIYLKRFYIEGR